LLTNINIYVKSNHKFKVNIEVFYIIKYTVKTAAGLAGSSVAFKSAATILKVTGTRAIIANGKFNEHDFLTGVIAKSNLA
jgi:hypothetical protein